MIRINNNVLIYTRLKQAFQGTFCVLILTTLNGHDVPYACCFILQLCYSGPAGLPGSQHSQVPGDQVPLDPGQLHGERDGSPGVAGVPRSLGPEERP